MEKILIGKVVNVVGLKGELKVYNYSDNLERFETLDVIYIGEKKYNIEKVRYKSHMIILKIEGIDTREESESMKNLEVFIEESQLEELPEGVYYIKDMIGMKVVSDKDEYIGELKDVLTNTAQKLYVVGRDGKSDVLIPGVDEFILDINKDENKITVKVIEGLYED